MLKVKMALRKTENELEIPPGGGSSLIWRQNDRETRKTRDGGEEIKARR